MLETSSKSRAETILKRPGSSANSWYWVVTAFSFYAVDTVWYNESSGTTVLFSQCKPPTVAAGSNGPRFFISS